MPGLASILVRSCIRFERGSSCSVRVVPAILAVPAMLAVLAALSHHSPW